MSTKVIGQIEKWKEVPCRLSTKVKLCTHCEGPVYKTKSFRGLDLSFWSEGLRRWEFRAEQAEGLAFPATPPAVAACQLYANEMDN